ncbi:MAG TPA: CsgG/HfaB family protein, partial [Gemmatimonadaceae bacterium]|nr:CsgG/HfaB family protein [Gemmatimonadaceae bacterium]
MKRSFSRGAWMLAIAAGLALPSLATAQAKPVVAVLYYDNNSIGRDRADYDGLGKGIADLLINDMASNPNVRVVERDRVQSVIQEQALARTGQVDPETAVRVGKMLGAQYMITGGFMNVNGT